MKKWMKEVAVMVVMAVLLLGGITFWQIQQDKYQNTLEQRGAKLSRIYEGPVEISSEIITDDWIVSETWASGQHGFAVFTSEEDNGNYQWKYWERVPADGLHIKMFLANGQTYHILLSGEMQMDYAEVALVDAGYVQHEETVSFEGRGIAVLQVPEWLHSWSPSATWYDTSGNIYSTD